jgi:NAD+ synthase (glutamine-hydrolysing)
LYGGAEYMRLVRLGVGAVSVKVGDFAGNSDRLRAVIDQSREKGVHLLVTPELSLSGYSLGDRVWWPDIARRSWDALLRLAESCQEISAFVGLPVEMDGLMFNGAALIHNGDVLGVLFKRHLPTHSIFYEGRNWTPGPKGATEVNGVPAGDLVFKLPFGMVSGEICEDMWAVDQPGQDRVLGGAEILCNLSASPFTPGRNEDRRRRVAHTAERLACAYVYGNLLGLDSCRLVFDGGGIIATPEGIVGEGPCLSKAPWTLATAVVDLDGLARFRSENSTWRSFIAQNDQTAAVKIVDAAGGTFDPAPVADYVSQLPNDLYGLEIVADSENAGSYLDDLFDALVLGVRDYFEKVGCFDQFLIALSGGRDSALCLLIAVEAAKALKNGDDADRFADFVSTVYLPTAAYSSTATHDAAKALADALGAPFKVVSIEEEAAIALEKAGEMMGGADKVSALAKQNLQARVRGTMMLNWANSANGLLLVTSNLSESAVGYTTTGGDNQGGYSPIANVPKTLVSKLLGHVAERDGIDALKIILDIPPSAELAPDQEDEADLMPYAVLDDLLYLFALRRLALSDCWRLVVHRHDDYDPEQLREWTAKFGRLFTMNQWKREQLPVALKVLDLDLDPKTGFRFPVTQSIEDELDELAAASL